MTGLLVVVLALAQPADERVRKLIEQLDAAEIETRDAAYRQLLNLSAEAIPVLEEAAGRAAGERRTRLEAVVWHLRRGKRIAAVEAALDPDWLKARPQTLDQLAKGTLEQRTAALHVLHHAQARFEICLDRPVLEDVTRLVLEELPAATPDEQFARQCLLREVLSVSRAYLLRGHEQLAAASLTAEYDALVFHAARYLAAHGDTNQRVAIRPLLDSRHSMIRKGAAQALSELGDAEAVPVLRKQLESRQYDEWIAATTALARLQADGATEPLLKVWDDSPSGEVPSEMSRLLIQLNSPAVREGARKQLADLQSRIPLRVDAAWILAETDPRDAVKELEGLLAWDRPLLRAAGACALHRAGRKEMLKVLIREAEEAREDDLRAFTAIALSAVSFDAASSELRQRMQERIGSVSVWGSLESVASALQKRFKAKLLVDEDVRSLRLAVMVFGVDTVPLQVLRGLVAASRGRIGIVVDGDALRFCSREALIRAAAKSTK